MVYTNLDSKETAKHGLFESSRITSTDVGRLYDVLVQNKEGNNIDVDNGVPVKVGDFTGSGLQERKATVAGVKDKVAIVGSPAVIKDAFTKAQEQAYNFYIPAGTLAKAYQVTAETEDIFGVAKYQFTNSRDTDIAVGAYVVTDGTGKWTAQADAPDASANAFIGKIHSVSVGTYYTIVRILVLQNKDIA